MFNPEYIRGDFPILARRVYDKPLVYLDNAATAQKPVQVMQAMDELMLKSNANVHRGIHRLSIESTEKYEAAREVVRDFIGARETAEVVFTSGATAAINTVAYSFGEAFIGEGDNVVISAVEHHSNIVPWQMVCGRRGAQVRIIPCDDNGDIDTGALSSLLDDRTRIVAVTGASNVLGLKTDLPAIISMAHSRGVPVLVDGCQSVVHGGVDVTELDCDFFAFSGHKLYGPTGIGVLYGKREWLERMPPFLGGGDMVARVSFEGTTFAELPLKFEAGTANYIGAVGLAEAIRYVRKLDAAEVERHTSSLLEFATAGIGRLDGVRIYGLSRDKCPIISFSADGVHPSDIGLILDKMGIAIRTGTHCAEPVMARFGLTGMCRASFAMYNTISEAEALVKGVRKALSMLR
ncbi:MAG: SufS family cysteine desulfurase [Alistipes sp.]|nr:SufS family cysteine desulfurase [Alistipes sp.]